MENDLSSFRIKTLAVVRKRKEGSEALGKPEIVSSQNFK